MVISAIVFFLFPPVITSLIILYISLEIDLSKCNRNSTCVARNCAVKGHLHCFNNIHSNTLSTCRTYGVTSVEPRIYFSSFTCHNSVLNMDMSWWRHQVETFSALLAICAGNSPVTGEFPTQRPVTRSFDVFFNLRLNERLSNQSCGWWFQIPSCPLWRHCNAMMFSYDGIYLSTIKCVSPLYGGVEGPPHIFFRHHAISYGWHNNSSVGDSNYCYVIRRTY